MFVRVSRIIILLELSNVGWYTLDAMGIGSGWCSEISLIWNLGSYCHYLHFPPFGTGVCTFAALLGSYCHYLLNGEIKAWSIRDFWGIIYTTLFSFFPFSLFYYLFLFLISRASWLAMPIRYRKHFHTFINQLQSFELISR